MDPGPAATEQGPDIRDQGPGTSVGPAEGRATVAMTGRSPGLDGC